MMAANLNTGLVILTRQLAGLLPRAIMAGLTIFAFYLVAVLARRLAKAAMSRTSTQGHVDLLIGQLSYIAVLVVGVVVALSLLINVTALVTSLGLAGVAVGFALKDIIGNFLAGILILAQRPFTIGDEITVGEVNGRVQDVRLRDTLVRTKDEDLVYIPNATVFNGVIRNHSIYKKQPILVDFLVAYHQDLEKTIEVVNTTLTELDIAEVTPVPQTGASGIEDDFIKIQAKFWISRKKVTAMEARTQAIVAIKQALTAAEIKPQVKA